MVSKEADSDVDTLEICANCGKEGANNTCNKCNMTKYCNAACKKRHRHKHKKVCEEHLKRAAELREEELKRTVDLHDIELFKQPPPWDDCPICFLLLPGGLTSGRRYKSCCGKTICSGCVHAVKENGGLRLCPFCRSPAPSTDEEIIRQLMKRVDAGDADATQIVAGYYSLERCGLPKDQTNALELWHRAGELGSASSYHNISKAYFLGSNGVEKDVKKAVHYTELAAMRGDAISRNNLGLLEQDVGNVERAIKHFMIAIRGGYGDSLKSIQKLYLNGHTTKDVYAQALLAYQSYLGEIRSYQRDQAAAFDEDYKYIGYNSMLRQVVRPNKAAARSN